MNQVLTKFSRIWSTLRKQSEPLQSIGAIFAILAVTVPTVIIPIYRHATRPTIIVRTDLSEDTRPLDIIDWMSNVSNQARFFRGPQYFDNSAEAMNALNELKNISNEERAALKRQLVILDQSLSNLREEYELLAGADSGITIDKLDEKSGFFRQGGLDKLQIEILNQSNKTVNDLSLRISSLNELWASTITGTFITPEETQKLEAALEANFQDQENYLALPKVPEIPPNSSLEITLYGDMSIVQGRGPEIKVESETNKVDLKQRVKLDNGRIVRLLLEPWRFYALLWLALGSTAMLIGGIITSRLSDHAYQQYQQGKKLYFAAQYLAKMNRYQEAISVFEAARTFGNFHFSNESQIREDQKLFPEDQQEEFLKVFSLRQSKEEK